MRRTSVITESESRRRESFFYIVPTSLTASPFRPGQERLNQLHDFLYRRFAVVIPFTGLREDTLPHKQKIKYLICFVSATDPPQVNSSPSESKIIRVFRVQRAVLHQSATHDEPMEFGN